MLTDSLFFIARTYDHPIVEPQSSAPSIGASFFNSRVVQTRQTDVAKASPRVVLDRKSPSESLKRLVEVLASEPFSAEFAAKTIQQLAANQINVEVDLGGVPKGRVLGVLAQTLFKFLFKFNGTQEWLKPWLEHYLSHLPQIEQENKPPSPSCVIFRLDGFAFTSNLYTVLQRLFDREFAAKTIQDIIDGGQLQQRAIVEVNLRDAQEREVLGIIVEAFGKWNMARRSIIKLLQDLTPPSEAKVGNSSDKRIIFNLTSF